jgi:hypothetical protein
VNTVSFFFPKFTKCLLYPDRIDLSIIKRFRTVSTSIDAFSSYVGENPKLFVRENIHGSIARLDL